MDERLHQGQEQQPDRDIDEEYPSPADMIRDPAADRGTDGRGKHHGHAIDRKRHAALGGGRGIREDGLGVGLQSATGNALQGPE